MQKKNSKELLISVVLAVVGAVLLVVGLRSGNTTQAIIGGLGLAFFGIGALVLVLASTPGKPVPSTPAPRTARTTGSSQVSKLATADKEALRRTVDVLASNGVFVPEVPEADDLEAEVADYGPPVTLESPLRAVFGTVHYQDSFRPERYTANLRQQSENVEQTAELIKGQLIDLAELSDGTLTIEGVLVSFEEEGTVTVKCTLNGEQFETNYQGAKKYLSTVLLQLVASRYESLGLPTRFAAVSSEGALYLTRLARGKAEEINESLGFGSNSESICYWLDDPAFAYEAGASRQ